LTDNDFSAIIKTNIIKNKHMSEKLHTTPNSPDDQEPRLLQDDTLGMTQGGEPNTENDVEADRQPLFVRARAVGGLALKATVDFGREKWQERSDRKQEAEDDYSDAPERPLDQLITDDKEILGEKSSLLRGKYRDKADSIVKKIENAEENRDVAGTREKYLKYRNNRTDIKIARLQEKLASSSGSFIAKHIDRQRRLTLENLQYRRKRRTGRIGGLETARKNKLEELRRDIDKLVNAKIDAMHRKAQRKVLKDEHGIDRHNFVKRAEFLAKMSKEDKRKITREAILMVRKKNIEKGVLDATYEVNDAAVSRRNIRGIYERTVE